MTFVSSRGHLGNKWRQRTQPQVESYKVGWPVLTPEGEGVGWPLAAREQAGSQAGPTARWQDGFSGQPLGQRHMVCRWSS